MSVLLVIFIWNEKSSETKKTLEDTSEMLHVYGVAGSNSKVSVVFCNLRLLFPLCKAECFTSTFQTNELRKPK